MLQLENHRCRPQLVVPQQLYCKQSLGRKYQQYQFLDADRPDIALHWLQLAVDQEHPDAMHNLAKLHIKGIGVPKDETKGLMWLAKAASCGHPIASQQVAALQSLQKPQ